MFLEISGVKKSYGKDTSYIQVLKGTDEKREVFNTQDGFFTVFQPIGDDDMATLTESGTQIQAEFCTDLSVDNDRKLRMFKNRTDIDKLILDKGRLSGRFQMHRPFIISLLYHNMAATSITDLLFSDNSIIMIRFYCNF